MKKAQARNLYNDLPRAKNKKEKSIGKDYRFFFHNETNLIKNPLFYNEMPICKTCFCHFEGGTTEKSNIVRFLSG